LPHEGGVFAAEGPAYEREWENCELMDTYYARTLHNRKERQLLKDHLAQVSLLVQQLANDACPGDVTFAATAGVAGLLHDLGKYRKEFQQYLNKERSSGVETFHAVYGAAAACCEFNSSPTAFAIAGHHADVPNASDLSQMIEGSKYSAARRYGVLLELLRDELGAPECSGVRRDSEDDLLRLEFMTRMLFSVLVDADRLNSEEWEKSTLLGAPWKRQVCRLHAECLLDRLIAARDQKARMRPADALNTLRNRIFDRCLQVGQKEQGFFSLTVPTGGGKTLSSMAFALSHARQHDLRRVIVVIPYLSIIEQNAREYRDIFGTGQVLEHHCAVESPEDKRPKEQPEPAEASSLEKAMENWDVPIVVTTSVQFIETLFSNKPGRVRKLHNVARSVVIFDEVQTMPVHLLNPTLDILRQLKDEYAVSFVFCSATQPAFRRSASVTRGFEPGEIQEIAPDPAGTYRRLHRVNYRIASNRDRWDWRRLAEQMLAKAQCLSVVNLRKHALAVWQELERLIQERGLDKSGLFHLSSAMCPAHRLEVLGLSKMPPSNNVKARLRDGKPCWVVSTQLIEAGVDVDFPCVFRAIGPLDSIVQSGGRCNREGTLRDERGDPCKGEVAVFYPEDDGIPQGVYQTATSITPSYLSTPEELALHPEIFGRYFTELYQLRPTDHSRQGDRSIQEDRQKLNFRNVAEHGKVIEDNAVSVVVPYGKGIAIVAAIRGSEKFDRDTLRQLQRYMVSVRHYQRPSQGRPSDFDRLKEAGAVVPLLNERLEIPVLEQRKGCSYSPEFGLVIGGISPEDLIA
jgi:CRISPR-associated endonuclease/helicase Cas3